MNVVVKTLKCATIERAKPTTYKAGWHDAVDSIPGPGVAVILVLCVLFDQNACTTQHIHAFGRLIYARFSDSPCSLGERSVTCWGRHLPGKFAQTGLLPKSTFALYQQHNDW